MNDLDEFGVVVKKENRRRKLTPKTHSVEMSSLPVSGEHQLDRKAKERLEREKLEELLKKS